MTSRVCDQAEALRSLAAERSGRILAGKRDASRQRNIDVGRNRPRVVVVTSGKGGVGKTNIAANLAVELARRGLATAVLDADLGLANVEVVLNCAAGRNLGDVLLHGCAIEEVWTNGPSGVRVMSAGSGVDWLANLTQNRRAHLIREALDACRGIDILVVDTAPGISSDVTDFLQVADEILIVTTCEPTALTDTYALIKTAVTLGVGADFELVVNTASERRSAERAACSIDSVCRRFLGRPVPRWDWIPFDHRVPDAVARQQPVVDLHPASAMSGWVRRKAAETVNRAVSIRKAGSR